MKLKMPTYDIIVETGGIEKLESYIKTHYDGNTLYVVTDQNVFGLYHEIIKNILKSYNLDFVVVEPGEKSKSFETYQWVISSLIEKGMKRNDLIIALGGGVVGDLAGFVASTIYRGVPFVQIPTSLLAQVDSSIGGKVAIDLKEGKNLVGAFYNPLFVLIDPLFLETLSQREYNQGVAEMIKSGLIKDQSLYEHFLSNDKVSETEIIKALKVKQSVVLEDPFDQGIRMILNFGHTYGHALEKKHNYETYKHGEAISYGMLIALKVGIEKGLTKPSLYDEVKSIFLRLNLVETPLIQKDKLESFIQKDKKNTSKAFHFICVKDAGESVIIDIKDGI